MAERKILVPLDGSDFSRQIIPHLCKYFDPLAHQVILLHVSQAHVHGLTPAPPVQAVDSWPTPAYQTHQDANRAKHPIYANQMRASEEAALLAQLRPAMANLQKAGFKASSLVKFGNDPAYIILDMIEQEGIDLIAMTTHARSGLSRLLFGSVAEAVLHHISIPILLLRPVLQPHSESENKTEQPLLIV
jgi:nucleotide-binding universal stress UspA family protein